MTPVPEMEGRLVSPAFDFILGVGLGGLADEGLGKEVLDRDEELRFSFEELGEDLLGIVASAKSSSIPLIMPVWGSLST